MNTSKRQQGFSLINGMISLAVIGVLFGSVIPTVTAMVLESRASTEYTEIANAFSLARSEAVTRRMNIQVSAEKDGEWTQGLIIWADHNNNGSAEETEVLHVLPALQTTAQLVEKNEKTNFYFTKQGLAKSSDKQAIAFSYQAEGGCDFDQDIRIKFTGRVVVKAAGCQ